MKNYTFILRRFLLCIALFLVFTLYSDGSPIIQIPQEPGIFPYIKANWAQIALIVSEAAALLPGKVKGIVQGVLSIIPLLFGKNSKS